MANQNILALIAQGGPAGPNDNFSRAAARGAAIDAQRSENAMRAEEMGRKRNVLQAFPAAMQGDANALEVLASNDPQTALALQDHQAKFVETKRKEAQARLQRYSQAALHSIEQIERLPEDQRQGAYESSVMALAEMDPEVFKGMGGAPREYNPQFAQQARMRLLPFALGEEGMAKFLQERMKPEDSTADQKNYRQAKGEGYKGSFQQWLNENKRGTSLTVGPDGTVQFSENGAPPLAPSKPTTNTLQETIVTSQAGLDRLRGIQQQFKPEYQTWEGRLKGGIASVKDKAGIDMSDEDKQYLGDFEGYRSSVLDNLNRHIKDITGASMSVQEAGRITRSMPNESDGPTAFKSKMDRVMRDLGRVQARAYYTLARGLSLDKVGIEQIDAIIRKRGDELMGELKDEKAVKAQLMREFGLGQ